METVTAAIAPPHTERKLTDETNDNFRSRIFLGDVNGKFYRVVNGKSNRVSFVGSLGYASLYRILHSTSIEKKVVSYLFDPKFFNYLIMFLYLVNALRWLSVKGYGDFFYWISALAITASVTFGYKH